MEMTQTQEPNDIRAFKPWVTSPPLTSDGKTQSQEASLMGETAKSRGKRSEY